MADFKECMERLKTHHNPEFPDSYFSARNYVRFPDNFFVALEQQLPQLWLELIGDDLLAKPVHYLSLLPLLTSVSGTIQATDANIIYGRYKEYIFRLSWPLPTIPDQPKFDFNLSILLPPTKNKRYRWLNAFLRGAVRINLFSNDFLEMLSQDLSDQLENLIELDLNSSKTFSFNPEFFEPKHARDRFYYFKGDLIGPDNFGTTLFFLWQLRPNALPPYEIKDIEPLENGRYFSWNDSILSSGLKERYGENKGNPPLTIPSPNAEIIWSQWWPSDLPDLSIGFRTSKPLSEKKLQLAENAFWTTLTNNALSLVGDISPTFDMKKLKTLVTEINVKNTDPTEEQISRDEVLPELLKILDERPDKDSVSMARVLEAAEQGFAKYFSGFSVESEGEYRFHVDFLGDYLQEIVIICWIRSLDDISQQFNIENIHVGW